MKNTRGFFSGVSRRAKKSLFFLLAFTLLGIGNLYSQQQARDFEFIFQMGPFMKTTLASNMGSNNWAFTSGRQNINELHSLLHNSIGSPTFNEANYQRLVDFILSSQLYVDLVLFMAGEFNISMETILNPEVTRVTFGPTAAMTQLDIILNFGGSAGTLSISRYPGLFTWEMSEGFDITHRGTNYAVRLYTIFPR